MLPKLDIKAAEDWFIIYEENNQNLDLDGEVDDIV